METINKVMEWSVKTHEGRAVRRFVKGTMWLALSAAIAYAQNDVRFMGIAPMLMGLEKYIRDKYLSNGEQSPSSPSQ